MPDTFVLRLWRDAEVAALAASGMTVREIASRLGISRKGVRASMRRECLS